MNECPNCGNTLYSLDEEVVMCYCCGHTFLKEAGFYGDKYEEDEESAD
jgi:ribosomal protein S27E